MKKPLLNATLVPAASATLAKLGLALVGAICLHVSAARAEVISSLGFESGPDGSLEFFVPKESEGAGCSYQIAKESPRSGAYCLKLHSDGFARFSISPKEPVRMRESKRYRVSCWARLGANAEIDMEQPGFLIRIMFKDWNGRIKEHTRLHLLPDGRISHNHVADVKTELGYLTSQWRKFQFVIEAPENTSSATAALFAWRFKGDLFIDDLLFEDVAGDEPLTPIVQK